MLSRRAQKSTMKFLRDNNDLADLGSRKAGRIYYMPLDQVENPPEHAHSAPPGEIRQEPRRVLILFTWIIALALVVPLLALVFEGVRIKHFELFAIGSALIVFLGIGFLLLLWKMISSRTMRRRIISLANRPKRAS